MTPQKLARFLGARVVLTVDLWNDLLVAHRSLVRTVPSVGADVERGIGATRSQPTHWWILERVFRDVVLTEADGFVDIGCGKGRAIAFLLREKAPCRITGVELNPEVARVAKAWTARHDNVSILEADAFSLDFDRFTVFYLFRPFLPKTFTEFIELLESQLTHPVRLVFLSQGVRELYNRPGWERLNGGSVYLIHGMPVAGCPQSWSVWRYAPVGCETAGASC